METTRFGEFLVQNGVLSAEELRECLEEQKRREAQGERIFLGKVLVERGVLTEHELKHHLRQFTKREISRLGGENNFIIHRIRARIGEERFREVLNIRNRLGTDIHLLAVLDTTGIMPYSEQKTFIYNIFAPVVEDLYLGDETSLLYDEKTRVYLLSLGEQTVPVEPVWCPRVNAGRPQVLLSFGEYLRIIQRTEKDRETEKHRALTFQDLVMDALSKEASDIHIVSKDDFYHVFFRIDGVLKRQPKYLLRLEEGEEFITRVKEEASLHTKGRFRVEEKAVAQDARIDYPELGVSLRLVFIPDGTLSKTSLTARLLVRRRMKVKSLEELGYLPEDAEVLRRVVKRRGGLLLISGITGSGKSTLAASLLTHIDSTRKVVTVEDPVEYVVNLPHVEQHQIYVPDEAEKKMGFLEYIKAFKRADPDVIFVGEIRRDPDLVTSVVEAAQAGQLVISTVHIKSAFDVYRALAQLFELDFYTLATTILFSLNQSLVPALCPDCRIEDREGANLAALREALDIAPIGHKDPFREILGEAESGKITTYRRGEGCQRCEGQGYLGRTPIYEYFFPTSEFVDWLLREAPSMYDIERKVCRLNIGKNRLQVFLVKLRSGLIEASDETLKALL
ncbi:GspE/PulE family protein [Thermosulfurimonas sp. F29]|uniref:GspE/PulE family protein n=1 Tax=Thermosulfurimonas sp. F29 TaxID=2867247 RepID=UPI001C828A8F|nr:ATPase, T2SS/T4P/T4SS family [Thermosulfurimonas sp. F29]MBX6424109.1 Flp pilus assembly complex ATPase component TadA [Thermosulfurimonas sp. F29]